MSSRIDVENTKFREREDLRIGNGEDDDFTRSEVLRIRNVLRRLRFLETQMRLNEKEKGADVATSAALHTAQEAEGLEFILGPDGIDYLAPVKG